MQKIIVCYKFKDMSLKDRNKFRRSLFGGIEKTHGGRYKTEFKGFLSDKNYEKPVRSVLVIDKNDLKGAEKILKSFKAEYFIYEIKQ